MELPKLFVFYVCAVAAGGGMKFRLVGAKAFRVLLLIFFPISGVGLSTLLLVVMPLIRWAIHGALTFLLGNQNCWDLLRGDYCCGCSDLAVGKI